MKPDGAASAGDHNLRLAPKGLVLLNTSKEIDMKSFPCWKTPVYALVTLKILFEAFAPVCGVLTRGFLETTSS